MKKIIGLVSVVALLLCSSCAPKITQEQYDAVSAERDQYAAQLNDLNANYKSVEAERDKLESDIASLNTVVTGLRTEKTELQTKIDSASDWFSLSADEQADMLVVLAERQAAREAQAAKEEQQGYETGITFEQLARTPDDYVGKKVKFTGIALQVLEGDGMTEMRIATRGRYDDIIYVAYKSNITSTRVLEDDKITIYGVSQGLYSYESTGSGIITLPLITVDQLVFVPKY